MSKEYAAESSIELIAHLDGEAFQLCFDKFTENGKFNDTATDLRRLSKSFSKRFSRKRRHKKSSTVNQNVGEIQKDAVVHRKQTQRPIKKIGRKFPNCF